MYKFSFFLKIGVFLYCIQAVLFLSGCKEKEPLPDSKPTNSEKILGTWTLKETLHNQNGQFINALYDCDLDDTWIFEANGLLTGSQNGTTCDPGSPNGFSTHYELQDNEEVLYLDFVSAYSKYKVVVLNDSILTLYQPLYEDVNGEVFAKITYKR